MKPETVFIFYFEDEVDKELTIFVSIESYLALS